EVLENKEQNFLFPFFWIRGEDEKTIRNYVNKVYETGIREICIESRPHPEYLKTGYWEDIEIILDEVEKLNMRVWFVDDEHFPTGSAAGRVKKEFPHLQKKYIRLHQIDVHGPQKNSFYDLKFSYFNNRNQLMESMMSDAKMNKDLQANILRILAAKQTDFNSIEIDTLIDITEYIENNILTWEVPEGRWKILVISETFDG